MPPFSTLSLPSSRLQRPHSGEHEPEPVFPDLYLISVAQVNRVDPDAVDVSSVEAPDVAYPVPPVSVHDLGVFAGDGDIVEEDAALLATADGDDFVAEVVHPPSRRALHLVQLDQSRPFGAARGDGLPLFPETRRVGDGTLARDELGPALRTELHRRRDFGPTHRTHPHRLSLSPSNTRARSSGESAATPRSMSCARIRS